MLTPEDTRALAALSTQLGTAGTSLYTALIHKIVLEGWLDLGLAALFAAAALAFIGLTYFIYKKCQEAEIFPPLVFFAGMCTFVCAAFAIAELHDGLVSVYAPEGVVAQHVLDALHGS